LGRVTDQLDEAVKLTGASANLTDFPNAQILRTNPNDVGVSLTNQLQGNRLLEQYRFIGLNGCVPTACAMMIDSWNASRLTTNALGDEITDRSVISKLSGINEIDFDNKGMPMQDSLFAINYLTKSYLPGSMELIHVENFSISSLENVARNGPVMVGTGRGASRHVIIVDAVGNIDGILMASVRDPNGIEYLIPISDLGETLNGEAIHFINP
jgi:hypothetical protein